jgi:hypothetical protein
MEANNKRAANTNNSNNNIRPNQNNELTINPVYGDVNLKNINQQRKNQEQVLNERETTDSSTSKYRFLLIIFIRRFKLKFLS